MNNPWSPGAACGALQGYIYYPDPRYQVRAEWVICRDGVRRIQYRAYCGGCVIGELQPSSKREAVLAELEQYITDNTAPVEAATEDVI